jgi:hypothetical protein
MLFSCTSRDPGLNPAGIEPEEIKGEIELDLRAYSITIWNTTSFSFNALSGGKFSIEARDTAIADVKVSGNTFTVKAKAPGTTFLMITDDAGREKDVRFCSYTFFRNWRESSETNFLYRSSVNVFTENKEVAAAIRAELAPVSRQRGRDYYFSARLVPVSVQTGEYYLESHGSLVVSVVNQGVHHGSFSWDESTRLLTLNFKGETEVYRCDLMPVYPNFPTAHPNAALVSDTYLPFIMSITQDFTAEYVSRYPDAGIIEVSIMRYIFSRVDFWPYTPPE